VKFREFVMRWGKILHAERLEFLNKGILRVSERHGLLVD